MSGRAWTAEEVELLRARWPQETAARIGRRLGKSTTSVLLKARTVGLSKARPRCWWKQPWVGEQLRRLIAEGRTDTEIAAGWIGSPRVDRRTVGYLRQRLGLLDRSPVEPRLRAARQQAVRTQAERLGVRGVCEIRRRHCRLNAARRGWPIDCSPYECNVLDVLADGQLRTRAEICAALRQPERPQRQRLQTGKGGGSVLGNLIARGLVVRTTLRSRRGVGKGFSQYEYYLSRKAEDFHVRATRRKMA